LDTIEPATTSDAPLSIGLAEAAIDHAAQVAVLDMPLPQGLRAAADEAASWRLSAALRSLARDVERGQSLDQCLAARSSRLPRHLAGLLRAALRTGGAGATLAEWIANRNSARQHFRRVLAALAYPAIAICLAIAVFLLFAIYLVGPFRQMFDEFGLKLPFATVYLFRSTQFGLRAIPAFLAAVALGVVSIRLLGGRAGWSWLVGNLPLVGNVWHWSGVAEMLRCLSLLVEQRVPLTEALRLAADGVTDDYVGSQCRALAQRVETGRSLTMSLVDMRTLPLSIVPLVHWGERHDLLADGLRSAAEMLEGRLKGQTDVLLQIVPPVIFLIVGISISSAVISLFLPMISLIQGLS